MRFETGIYLTVTFVFSQTFCIDVLRFDDPKETRINKLLKTENISDDAYEMFFEVPDLQFPVGQDFSVCYRWYFDHAQFTDPGLINLHLKLYTES